MCHVCMMHVVTHPSINLIAMVEGGTDSNSFTALFNVSLPNIVDHRSGAAGWSMYVHR